MLRCESRRISSAYRKAHTCRQHDAALNGGMAVSRRASPTPGQIRGRRIRAAGILVRVLAIAAALGHQLLASASSRDRAATNAVRSARGEPGELNGALRPRTRQRALGEADGG